jgi:acyl carrier protein
MKEQDVMNRIRSIVQSEFGDPGLQVDEYTTAVMVPGWDSQAQIRILMAVEEAFEVQFSSREMDRFKKVGDLVAAVCRYFEDK